MESPGRCATSVLDHGHHLYQWVCICQLEMREQIGKALPLDCLAPFNPVTVPFCQLLFSLLITASSSSPCPSFHPTPASGSVEMALIPCLAMAQKTHPVGNHQSPSLPDPPLFSWQGDAVLISFTAHHALLSARSIQCTHSADVPDRLLCARHKAVSWGHQGELNGHRPCPPCD